MIFGEELFTVLRSAKHASFWRRIMTAECDNKHAHNLLVKGSKVGESSRWKNIVIIEDKFAASKKLGLQIF